MSDVVVIIPCLNCEATLARQLAALNNQNDLDFDVVVSDNGSTDRTRSIALAWKPSFNSLTVVDSSATRGVAHARNSAVQATTQPMVLICDGDDAVHATWVSAMREALSRHSCATGPLRMVYPDSPRRTGEVINGGSVPISMNYRPFMPGGNMAFHREVFDAVSGFDETLSTGQEDVDFGWRLSGLGYEIAFSPAAVVDYYQRSGLLTYFRQQWRYGRAHVALFERHKDSGVPVASVKTSLRWFVGWARHAPSAFARGRGRDTMGALVFQVARNLESARRRTLTPK